MSSITADTAAPSSRLALASLSLAMLLASLGISIANVALPTLAGAFGASFQATQWVVLAYLLAITALVVGAGRLGDILGRRRLLLAGLAIYTAGSLASGLAPSLAVLVAARAVQGVGAAILMALTMAFVGEIVPKQKTGSAMGLLGTMSAVGTALGPSLGGVLIAAFGWRSIFLVSVPLGILALVFAYRALPADQARPTTRPRFDHLGTLLLALTLVAYALAMTLGRCSFGALNIALLMVAAVGGGAFVYAQRRTSSPLLQLATFRDAELRAGFATSALVSTVVMTTLVVGPFYLARALGLDAATVGLVMSAGPIVAALTGIPAGRIVDRFGTQRMIVAGLVAMMAGCSALASMPMAFGIAGYVVPLVVTTAGYALFQAANNTAVMADVPGGQRGVISGVLNLSRNLGLVTGTAAMGAVFAFAAGDIATANPDAVSTGMRVTFAVAAMLIVAAILIAGRRR